MEWTTRPTAVANWEVTRGQAYYLLNEDGTYLLNEDGSKILLEESSIFFADWTPRIIPT